MSQRLARSGLGLALIAGAALGLPAVASGASITLDRVPSPPQAITPAQAEQINYSVSYTSDHLEPAASGCAPEQHHAELGETGISAASRRR